MRTRTAIVRSAAIVLLAALAACTGGSPGSPSLATSDAGPDAGRATPSVAAGSPSAAATTRPPTPTPGPSATASPGPGATAVLADPTPTLPADPPVARLNGLTGGPMIGDLGTASWGGMTSDAPWIVGRDTGHAAAGTPLTVTFEPTIQPESWQARWAPIDGRDVGEPRNGGSGTGEVRALTAPGAAGAWSLQLEARFGPDSSGAWYWRIRVDR